MKKLRVGILCGGRSAEHEVSLISAKNIIAAMDKNKYEIVPIGIDKKGVWHLRDVEQFLVHSQNVKSVQLNTGKASVTLIPEENLVSLSGEKISAPLDVIFPVLHGTYGEDGTMQGLLKLADIPFVGAGVLGSAVGMDKDVMKRLFRDAGIPTARFITVRKGDMPKFEDVVKELGMPLFVKPANLGSSVGVSKVKSKGDWTAAIEKAFLYDRKILIEEFIEGREMECSILGNENPIASLLCEPIPKDEFYTYEAKYLSESGTVFLMPAPVDKPILEKIQQLSIQAFKVLCCEGMARVDSFLKPNGEVYINEINTIPGFTPLSPYPTLWEISGISRPELIDRLIQLALDRYQQEKQLKTTF